MRDDLPEISWFDPADYWLGTWWLGAIKKGLFTNLKKNVLNFKLVKNKPAISLKDVLEKQNVKLYLILAQSTELEVVDENQLVKSFNTKNPPYFSSALSFIFESYDSLCNCKFKI